MKYVRKKTPPSYHKRKSPFKPGAMVKFGERRGVIVEEWGSMLGCLKCANLLTAEQTYPARGASGLKTTCCNSYAVTLNGRGIYDVKFKDGTTTSIAECWLTISK